LIAKCFDLIGRVFRLMAVGWYNVTRTANWSKNDGYEFSAFVK